MKQEIPSDLRPFVSPCHYQKAVVLCALSGIVGAHWFYLGRIRYGLIDAGTTVVAIVLFFLGHPFIAGGLLFADWIHSVVVTFRLLTGMEVDSEGRRIVYPGQNLAGIVRKKPFL